MVSITKPPCPIKKFESKHFPTLTTNDEAAEIANRVLEDLWAEAVAQATEVFQKRTLKDPYSLVWAEYENDAGVLSYKGTGLMGRLFCIEPIEDEGMKNARLAEKCL